MPLDSDGRILLKIYNQKGQLLVSRSCPNLEFAEEWYTNYREKWKHVHSELYVQYAEMVPRI